MAPLGLKLGLRPTVYRQYERRFVRWLTSDGVPLPTAQERAAGADARSVEAEARAEREHARAEQERARAEELEARLKALEAKARSES